MPPPDVVKRDRKKPGDRTTTGGFIDTDNDKEPTEPKGLLEAIIDLDPEAADAAIQRAFLQPNGKIPEFERTLHPRRERDEDRQRPRSLRPAPEEEEIVPGNPDDLGARGKRRRTIDEVNNPPLLRRGLLGV